jgi:hypothetical protein
LTWVRGLVNPRAESEDGIKLDGADLEDSVHG